MQPFIFWRALLARNTPPALFRNSDDFFPDIPSSHNWHVFTNCMNSLLSSHLNGLPDYDMFQSSLKPYGSLHALARCISGGPVYITDSPGSHDMEIINSMSAMTPRGDVIILRPSLVAQPTDPYIIYDGPQLLTVSNFIGGRGGTSLLAVFNTSQHELSKLFHLSQFVGISEDETYAIRAHASRSVIGNLTSAVREEHMISLTLPKSGWEIFTAVRLERRLQHNSDKAFLIGCFGLTDKLTGAAAITAINVGRQGVKTSVMVSLKALGILGKSIGSFIIANSELN